MPPVLCVLKLLSFYNKAKISGFISTKSHSEFRSFQKLNDRTLLFKLNKNGIDTLFLWLLAQNILDRILAIREFKFLVSLISF